MPKTLVTLDDFECAIARTEALALALPADHNVHLDHPDPCDYETLEDFEAAPPAPYIGAANLCGHLARLSQEIRSRCWSWNCRDLARAVAAKADEAAARVAAKFRLGCWGPAILPIKGSVGHTADGRPYGGRY